MQQWLFLVHRIPSRPLYLRAKMLQRLTAAGAIAVKNSVYLLPHQAETLEDLQWIAQEIAAGGGDAHLIAGDFVDGAASESAVAQFRRERDTDYAAGMHRIVIGRRGIRIAETMKADGDVIPSAAPAPASGG